jgi:hypothetical protein
MPNPLVFLGKGHCEFHCHLIIAERKPREVKQLSQVSQPGAAGFELGNLPPAGTTAQCFIPLASAQNPALPSLAVNACLFSSSFQTHALLPSLSFPGLPPPEQNPMKHFLLSSSSLAPARAFLSACLCLAHG